MAEERMQPATVYIVDDNAAVRDAIRWLVEEVGLKAQTYVTAKEFLADYDGVAHGCLVLDVRMPGMSGLDLQEQLVQHNVTLPIIVVTGHGDVPMAVRSMKMGAFEFLQKPFNDQALLDCIFAAINYHSAMFAEQHERSEASCNLAKLTRRQLEILSLMRAGKSSKEIANELHISVRTVEGHRAHIMDKMHASTIAQLIELAHKADYAC